MTQLVFKYFPLSKGYRARKKQSRDGIYFAIANKRLEILTVFICSKALINKFKVRETHVFLVRINFFSHFVRNNKTF